MGTETTPIRAKSRREQFRERSDELGDPLQRSWPDVNKVRVVCGLAVAALPPCAFFWLMLIATGDVDTVFARVGFKATALGLCWFIGIGSLFLALLGHTYGEVGRFNCLALCGSLAFFLPLLIGLVSLAGRNHPLAGHEVLTRIINEALSGVLYGPLGVLGGWMLWGIAVRPASPPLQEMAKVF